MVVKKRNHITNIIKKNIFLKILVSIFYNSTLLTECRNYFLYLIFFCQLFVRVYPVFISVDVLLKPAGDAPIMKKKRWAVERSKKVSSICEFIKKYIKCDPSDSMVSH